MGLVDLADGERFHDQLVHALAGRRVLGIEGTLVLIDLMPSSFRALKQFP